MAGVVEVLSSDPEDSDVEIVGVLEQMPGIQELLHPQVSQVKASLVSIPPTAPGFNDATFYGWWILGVPLLLYPIIKAAMCTVKECLLVCLGLCVIARESLCAAAEGCLLWIVCFGLLRT